MAQLSEILSHEKARTDPISMREIRLYREGGFSICEKLLWAKKDKESKHHTCEIEVFNN